MSPSINQLVPVQVLATALAQGGMAASSGTEPVGAIGKLRLVVR